MESSTPRSRRRQRRTDAIRDTALELVVELGLHEFSIHKLAERLDLSPGALYRYFDSRDALLMAVQTNVLEGFDRYLRRVVADTADEPLLARIVAVSRAWIALAQLQPERFALIVSLISAPQPLFGAETLDPAAQRVARMLAILAELIDEGQASELFDTGKAVHRAVVAWSSLQGLVERRKLERLDPHIFSFDDLENELLRTLLRGWGAPGEAVNAAVNTHVPLERLRRLLTDEEGEEDA